MHEVGIYKRNRLDASVSACWSRAGSASSCGFIAQFNQPAVLRDWNRILAYQFQPVIFCWIMGSRDYNASVRPVLHNSGIEHVSRDLTEVEYINSRVGQSVSDHTPQLRRTFTNIVTQCNGSRLKKSSIATSDLIKIFRGEVNVKNAATCFMGSGLRKFTISKEFYHIFKDFLILIAHKTTDNRYFRKIEAK